MRITISFFLCLSLLSSLSVYGQVVDTKRGKVEFIGLEQWNVNELVDTLRAISPNKTLHACAADLRRKLGFPDASAIGYYDKNKNIYTVITVIEDQYRDQIEYLNVPSDTLQPVKEWEKTLNVFQKDPQSFNWAIQFYGNVLQKNKEKASEDIPNWINKENIMAVWNFLLEHQSVKDKELAYWILKSDGNYKNRMIAAAILANFTESDYTWWMLIDEMRFPDARASNVAQAVVNTTLETKPRIVNWQPAVHSLKHLMEGTNLFAYNTVLEMLAQTGMDEKLATQLLTERASWLLQAYLESNFQKVRDYGQTFLSAFMEEKENRDWIKSLHQFTDASN